MSKVKELIRFKTKKAKYRLTMVGLTFLLHKIENRTFEDKRYYLQLSTQDMWLLPKKDTVGSDGAVTFWGWLFFYVGCDTEMLRGK